MKKYNLIILASSEKGPLFHEYGCRHKALFPIHGKPMLDWVVEAFHDSGCIKNIVIVGNDELERAASIRYVRKLIPFGFNLVQNLGHAAAYIRSVIDTATDEHDGYLISFCDAPFLTPEIIRDTVRQIEASEAEAAATYISKGAYEREGLSSTRNFIPMENDYYVGGTVYFLKRIVSILGFLGKLNDLHHYRRNPEGMLKVIGCEGKGFYDVERGLSKFLSLDVKLLESIHPQIGMNVEHPQDVELAKSVLPDPWKHHYKKAKLIYNPNAGRGAPLPAFIRDFAGIKRRKFEVFENQAAYIPRIETYMRDLGIELELEPTERAGHATEIAKQCVEEKYDLVVAAGGDGTINEVVNGMAGSDTAMGVIPMGTANVFALEMNLPVEIEAACQVIASGRRQRIDLGQVNDRYFVCMAGIGFDAKIIKDADSRLKRIWGGLAYPVVGFKQLLTYRFKKIVVMIDDQPIPRQGYFVIVNNGRYYGGNVVFASHADVSDGLLDVCIFKHKNILSVLNYLFGFSKGKIDKHLTLEYFQCRKVEILKKGKHGVHVDAEYMCKTPVSIQVKPASLTIAV